MKAPPAAPTLSDKAITALLERYKCPKPFAAVRTLLMGSIASPSLNVSPLAALETLWEGQMPKFESGEDAQALVDALIGGLWNRLAEHQSSQQPFALLRAPVALTRLGLEALALMRTQEIAGFVAGLFGKEDQLHLPEKAHRAIQTLADIHSMFAGAADLLADETKPAPAQGLAEFARNAQQMTSLAEAAINKAAQACKRARDGHREPMGGVPRYG
jgi:hypothetical protein